MTHNMKKKKNKMMMMMMMMLSFLLLFLLVYLVVTLLLLLFLWFLLSCCDCSCPCWLLMFFMSVDPAVFINYDYVFVNNFFRVLDLFYVSIAKIEF